MKRIKKTIDIKEDTNRKLLDISNKMNISQTKIIENCILSLYKKIDTQFYSDKNILEILLDE